VAPAQPDCSEALPCSPIDLLRSGHDKIEALILDQAGFEQPKEKNSGAARYNV